MIPVTKPFLPPIEEYMAQVQRAYNNEWLTNRGELVLELETKIQEYLGSKSKPIAMNNGTIPLQIAIKLLGGGGEIITTPFSYVATTSTIVWEGCTPIFVDIDPVYWTIDETKIEEAITEKTTCILATHVFGNPCNVEEIERIAKKHNLYVIYDISTCSFHATKIFHTGEGGAAFVNNEELYDKVFYSHNFGHNSPTDFKAVGINGKMSELQAAMGLSVLNYIGDIIVKRMENHEFYIENLSPHFRMNNIRTNVNWNYSYSQLVLNGDIIKFVEDMGKLNISFRRYFFPSLNNLPFVVNSRKPISEYLSNTIVTIPNYVSLSLSKRNYIVDKIKLILEI
jgi:dTDP-4-amino-4,6-dideoxygalactose transaminase